MTKKDDYLLDVSDVVRFYTGPRFNLHVGDRRRLAGESATLVSERAAGGDEKAREQFAQVARDFAIGVHNMVHCFSPEVVVIGGGMSKSGDMLLDPVRRMLEEFGPFRPASNVRVVQAAGGDDVGLKGAAAFWADYQKE